jgi:signal transduction histidine kinase/CheY-like chemotaxis protein
MIRYPILVIFFINIFTFNVLGNDKNAVFTIENVNKILASNEEIVDDSPEKALLAAEQIINSFEKKKNSTEYIRALHLKAKANSTLENYTSALVDFKVCLSHHYYNKDTNNLAELKFDIASCYHCLANVNGAMQWYFEALKLYQSSNNIYGQAKVLQNIGIIESERRRDSLALVYYNKAYDLYKILGKFEKQAAVLQNIGVVYLNREDYKNTIDYYKRALRIFSLSDNSQGIASVENNLGIIYERTSNYGEAFKHYKNALVNFQKLNSRSGLAYIYDNLASLYRRQNKNDSAVMNYKLSIQYADSIHMLDFVAYANGELAEFYEETGNYEESLIYYKAAKQIQDSIMNTETRRKFSQAEEHFQSELKDIEIQKKEFQLKVQRREKAMLIAGIVLLLLLITGLIWAYRKKTIAENQLRKQKEILTELFKQRTHELKIETFERKAAEEADKLKTAFLANMSHEIRTPMNAILAFSNFLKDPEISSEQRNEYVKYINSCSVSLLHLIDDILDTAKIEAKQLKIVTSKCYVNSILKELYVYFQNHKKCLNGNIRLEIKPECIEKNYAIITDGTRLRQIISNLLDNAFKFTDQGKIEFGFEVTDNVFHFYVRDTGTGIPIDKMQFVFKRFGQLHDQSIKVYKGTGLGLSISKNLVTLLGGNMWVESKEGEGSCFFFTLPANDLEITEIKSALPAKDVKTENLINWRPFNILIAEDDDLNYKLIDIALKKTPAKITRATNGEEVLDILAQNRDINLVLMDIQMPVLDGYETTRRAKALYPGIFIIAQTAFAMSDDKEKCLDAGCDDYISKPIDIDELYGKLEHLLDKV